jgi:hypothetical protein
MIRIGWRKHDIDFYEEIREFEAGQNYYGETAKS